MKPKPVECFGRTEERKLLQEFLQRAIAGDQQLVLIEGEAGIGKTALLLAFAREHGAGRREARVFYLAASADEAYSPVHHAALAATDQRLYDRFGGRRQAKEMARSVYAEYLGLIPVVGDIVAAIAATIEKIRERRRGPPLTLGGSVDEDIDALLAASRRKPLILLLDDLEKADANEVARLEKLICVADEGARILIVGAFRPAAPGGVQPPVKRLLTSLPEEGELFVHHRLAPLSVEGVADLLREKFRGPEPPAPFVQRLFDATGGHPGALREALVDLQFRRGVWKETRGWRYDADISMPVLRGEAAPVVDLTGLADDVAKTVVAASVIGAEFDGTTLAAMTGEDELLVEDRLAAAVHFGMLDALGEEVLPDGDIISRYRFAAPHVVPFLRQLAPAELRAAHERSRKDATPA
jgi:predicted ATPase